MKRYIEYLKSRGYKVNGNIAVLQNVRFAICEGKIMTAMGMQNTHWLQIL